MSKLSEFLTITTANSEEDVNNLLLIMNPKCSSEEDLGDAFVSELGYNPITYFDERSIEDSLDALIEGMKGSPSALNTLISMKRDIATDVLKYLNDAKSDTIIDGMANVISPLLNDEDTCYMKRTIRDIFGIEMNDDMDSDSSITLDDEEESIDEYTDDDDDINDDDGVDIDDYEDMDS